MPKITKRQLLEGVLQALSNSGWAVDVLTAPGTHPMRVAASRGRESFTALIYIWNVTHGGGLARHRNEYRIQVTGGVSRFAPSGDEKTVILGWSEEFGVYVGFDARRHVDPLGASPSMQISKATLLRAGEIGAATYIRRNNEVAVAVSPDVLGGYFSRLEMMHQKATASREVKGLQRDLDSIPDRVLASVEPSVIYVQQQLAEGKPPVFGDSNEAEQRKTILARLEKLERVVGIATDPPASIGHNHPPEPIDDDSASETRKAIISASDIISAEIAKARPRVEEIAKQTGFLATIASALRSAAKGSTRFAGKVKEKAIDNAAGIVATALVTGGGASLHPSVGHMLNAALVSVSTWFKMIF